MSSQPETWITVARGTDERACAELALVLTARGIAFEAQRGWRGWELWVNAADAQRAAEELEAYRRENLRVTGERRVAAPFDGWPGAIAYCAVLLAVFVAVKQSFFGLDWLGAGRVEGDGIAGGELWRAVTALTVHLDLGHLAGNFGFGAFFGYFVGRHLGLGVGWLAIVAAATLGNVVSALLQGPDHRSIGASTAVFAMLGLLTAYTWRRGYLRSTPWRARIAPIVAGLGLLAFTGTAGENTDLGAHLFGFLMGFGAGAAVAEWLPLARLKDARLQRLAGLGAAALVLGAWVLGLALAG
jgi:rhomboid protease GluP